MLRIIGIVIAVLVVAVAAVLIYAATRPDTFGVQRTATIDAPPDRVFPLLADFRRWGAWSPYEKRDPEMKRDYSGAASGVGAVYAWQSASSKVGAGRMEIIEAAPPTRLTLRLEFTRPFEARNTVVFTLKPNGDATEVTWAMHGPMPFVSKVMSVFMSMDAMVGTDFDAGLANLKAAVEKQAQPSKLEP